MNESIDYNLTPEEEEIIQKTLEDLKTTYEDVFFDRSTHTFYESMKTNSDKIRNTIVRQAFPKKATKEQITNIAGSDVAKINSGGKSKRKSAAYHRKRTAKSQYKKRRSSKKYNTRRNR